MLPGVFMNFVNVSYAAIFLLAVISYRSHGRDGRFLLPVAIIAGVLAGLLVTSKTWIILSLLFYFLGRYYANGRMRGVVVGGLVVAVAYFAVTPFVHFVRNDFGQSSRDLAQTASLWSDYFGGDNTQEDETQWWFLRLSYVSAQAFALAEYENGSPGSTVIEGARNLLVPRFLYPDKPVRSLGNDFSALYGGNSANSISPGIFAEAYWNGGWVAVFVVSALAGLLLGASHRFVVAAFKAENWAVLPLCLGLFLGLGQINGFFSNVYVYLPIVLILFQLSLAALILFLIGNQTKGPI